jgi:glycosyltransferase involved in cell wall biosynthesis
MQLIYSLRRGGAERVALEVSAGLRQMGHDIRVVRMLDLNEYLETAYQEVPHSFLLPKAEYRWPYSVPRLARALRREIRGFKPQVVAIHTPAAAVVAAWAGLKVPSVHVLHGYGVFGVGTSLKARLWRALQRWAFRRLDGQIAVVASGMQHAAADFYRCPVDAVHCLRNGVDIARFPFRERALAGGHVITMVGTLASVKHPEHGLRALKRLLETRPGSRLRFVGDGALRGSLQAEASAIRIDRSVEWLGRREDVPTLLAESHLLWHLSESEGLPMAVVEAMATGLPVVGYDVRGVHEVVVDGSTGFLAPFGNIEMVARKSLALLDQAELYQAFSRNARLRVEAEFSKDKMIVAHEELLARLAGSRAGFAPLAEC